MKVSNWEKEIASHGFVVRFICMFFICLFISFWFLGMVFVEFAKEIHRSYESHRGG